MEMVSPWTVCGAICGEIQERVPYAAPALAALAVAGTVYFIWGKFACMGAIALGALAFQLSDRAREIVRFDFSTLGILVTAVGMPFLGGPLAYVGGAYMASSVLVHQWQQYKIFLDMKRAKEEVERNNLDLSTSMEQVRAQAISLQDGLVKLQLADQSLDQLHNADQTLVQQNKDLKGKLQLLGKELQRINLALTQVNAKADVVQTIGTYSKKLAEISKREEELNAKVEDIVTKLESQTDQWGQAEQGLQALVQEIRAELAKNK